MNRVIIGECKHPLTYPFHNTTNGEKGSYCHDCGAKLPADASPSEPQERKSYWLVELDGLSFRFTRGGTSIITCTLNDPRVDKNATEAEAIKWGETLEKRSPWMKGRWKAIEHLEIGEAAPTPAGSEEPKLKDDPLGIEFARRVAGAHTKLTQDLISSAAPVASQASASKRPEPIQWVHLSKYSTTEYFLGSDATSYMDYLEGRVRELEAFAYRCIRELEYVQSLSGYDNGSLCASSEGRACVADGMKMIGVEMLGEETLDDERKTEANHE
jgi:hypothetical protein